MRGEVLSFDPATGAGLISGADGQRYAFTTADLAAPVPAYPGALLEFTPDGGRATRITPAVGQQHPQGFGGAATPSSGLFSPVCPDFAGEPDLSIWAYAKRCLRKYADFNGRARRKEYWSFVLVETLIVLPLYLALVAAFIVLAVNAPDGGSPPGPAAGGALAAVFLMGGLAVLITLARILPTYAALARRFHDVGVSAWWILLGFVPGASLLLLVVAFMPSQQGANIYGGYPKPLV